MKKSIFFASAAALMVLPLMAQEYELRVLTFEDEDVKDGFANLSNMEDWSGLVDAPQYGGPLLFGVSGAGSTTQYYDWTDGGNTFLHSELCEGYGSYCFWSGGHAISNYGTSDIENNGSYEQQLTVFHALAGSLSQNGHGHNGSDNFAIHYGYADNSGWSLTEETLPAISFADGKAHVIDHMYVTNTTYSMNVYVSGNGLAPKLQDGEWVKIVATGYNGALKTDTACFYLCNGPEHIVMDWTKFDLVKLGAVTKVSFNITGSSDNGLGFSQPAYFAYDDVAVRFYKEQTGFEQLSSDKISCQEGARLVMRDGKIEIIYHNTLYDMTGKHVK